MGSLKPPEIKEADYENGAGYFFHRLGEIALGISSLPDNGIQGGIASRVAVASESGVITFCDSSGK